MSKCKHKWSAPVLAISEERIVQKEWIIISCEHCGEIKKVEF